MSSFLGKYTCAAVTVRSADTDTGTLEVQGIPPKIIGPPTEQVKKKLIF